MHSSDHEKGKKTRTLSFSVSLLLRSHTALRKYSKEVPTPERLNELVKSARLKIHVKAQVSSKSEITSIPIFRGLHINRLVLTGARMEEKGTVPLVSEHQCEDTHTEERLPV